MPITISRKHPQGIKFTKIILVICSQCGNHESEMHHETSRAFNNLNDNPTYQIGNTCWECFFKE